VCREPSRRSSNTFSPSSVAQIDEAEKLWPHHASVTALTLRVETLCTYISAKVPTNAFSER
jgi:hypothetical protein